MERFLYVVTRGAQIEASHLQDLHTSVQTIAEPSSSDLELAMAALFHEIRQLLTLASIINCSLHASAATQNKEDLTP